MYYIYTYGHIYIYMVNPPGAGSYTYYTVGTETYELAAAFTGRAFITFTTTTTTNKSLLKRYLTHRVCNTPMPTGWSRLTTRFCYAPIAT